VPGDILDGVSGSAALPGGLTGSGGFVPDSPSGFSAGGAAGSIGDSAGTTVGAAVPVASGAVSVAAGGDLPVHFHRPSACRVQSHGVVAVTAAGNDRARINRFRDT